MRNCDKTAADAVRGRIDWQYALGLELTDAGFDVSVLSEFRTRLITGGAEEHLLTQMPTLFVGRGLLKARGTQRTDATHIVAAVRELNRLDMVGETLHHALNGLAQVAPGWLQDQISAEWFLRYGQRFSDYRLPKEPNDRHMLAVTIGCDGYHVLTQIYRDAAPPYLKALPAVDILRQVWVQQYYHDHGEVRWRDHKNFPPSALMIASPYDLEARYRRVQSTVQKPRGRRGHHFAGGFCVGDAAHAVSRVTEDPPSAHRDRHCHESAAACGLVVGDAALENVPVSLRSISTGHLIRQQHLFRTYPGWDEYATSS